MAILNAVSRRGCRHPTWGNVRIARRMLCGLLVAASALAQTYQEHEVKAAFLYNFAKFTTWPADKLASGTLNVCVIGEDPFGSVLDAMMRDKVVRGVHVNVARYTKPQELTNCHIVFVGISSASQVQEVMQLASKCNFLTVGETTGFAENGGMIGLTIQEGRVQFQINLAPLKRGGLQVSSKLLELAAIVRGR